MKKNLHTVRLLLVALVLCLVIPLAVACGGDQTQTPVGPGGTSGGGGSKFDIYDVEDSLPASKNYDSTFTILYYNANAVSEFYVKEDTGGVIDGAVFDAIANTEERFGVTIEVIPSGASAEIPHINSIRTQISSGKTDFDIARVHDVQGANLSLDGSLMDLNTMDVLDFSKPWWPENTINSLSFMGQLYLASSSMSYRGLNSANAIFFNKGLLEDHGMDMPYDLVKSNEWYLSTMLEMLEDVHIEGEENIDGKSEDDTFGIVIPSQLYSWQESFGIEMVKKTDDEDMPLELNGHDIRMYDAIDQLYNILHEQEGGYLIPRVEAATMFGQNRALYIPISLGYAISDFRNYEGLDYGIVPMPMLDEEQGQYYSAYTDRYFVVPASCPDKEYVGTILESMSAEGYRVVTPVYFEVALKDRYTRDEISKEMVDLIKQTMILDFSYVYGNDKWWSRSLYNMFNQNDTAPNKDYASYYANMLSAAESRRDEIIAAFQDMAERQQAAN